MKNVMRDLLAGACLAALATEAAGKKIFTIEGVSDGQLFGVFIECPECGTLNDVNS